MYPKCCMCKLKGWSWFQRIYSCRIRSNRRTEKQSHPDHQPAIHVSSWRGRRGSRERRGSAVWLSWGIICANQLWKFHLSVCFWVKKYYSILVNIFVRSQCVMKTDNRSTSFILNEFPAKYCFSAALFKGNYIGSDLIWRWIIKKILLIFVIVQLNMHELVSRW